MKTLLLVFFCALISVSLARPALHEDEYVELYKVTDPPTVFLRTNHVVANVVHHSGPLAHRSHSGPAQLRASLNGKGVAIATRTK
ncbi:unnamed protein product [Caenorhabditis sp. 36 PRJEB53466]|nr:unnamed protein product [Caenorhabditis sp. 36 PRJEB53466]